MKRFAKFVDIFQRVLTAKFSANKFELLKWHVCQWGGNKGQTDIWWVSENRGENCVCVYASSGSNAWNERINTLFSLNPIIQCY